MKFPVLALFALILAGCADPTEPLTVKQFQLRDQVTNSGEDPMVQMEKQRRLRGAVSMEERRQRLGQYYTLIWSDPAGAGSGPVEVLFEYRQGRTGSEIKRMSELYPASVAEGVVEFAVVGDNYFDNGKVLAWRASVSRGGREIAAKQSFLWE